jgi:hypothetical protein
MLAHRDGLPSDGGLVVRRSEAVLLDDGDVERRLPGVAAVGLGAPVLVVLLGGDAVPLDPLERAAGVAAIAASRSIVGRSPEPLALTETSAGPFSTAFHRRHRRERPA